MSTFQTGSGHLCTLPEAAAHDQNKISSAGSPDPDHNQPDTSPESNTCSNFHPY